MHKTCTEHDSRTNGGEAAYEKKQRQNPEYPRHVATRTVKVTQMLLMQRTLYVRVEPLYNGHRWEPIFCPL